MLRLTAALLVVSLIGPASAGRTRAVRHSGQLPSPKSVMWIGAHPDDEAVVAPLLAKWCLQDGARCTLVVLTRGESGGCALQQGCSPDVKTTRTAEAGAASELFHADAVVLRYPDGGGSAPPPWNDPSIECPDPVSTVSALIEAFTPELILTFDPRHGTTCHPDHRETGRVVLMAADHLSYEPAVYLLETRVSVTAEPVSVRFFAATVNAERFDATQELPFASAESWDAVVWDMERHPSQFSSEFVSAVRNVPPAERAVFIAPAATSLQQSVLTCP